MLALSPTPQNMSSGGMRFWGSTLLHGGQAYAARRSCCGSVRFTPGHLQTRWRWAVTMAVFLQRLQPSTLSHMKPTGAQAEAAAF